ncbi:hypothetical protein [Sedimentibacter sp. MB31-C6]|uniref:hypothetical protein n=1 Tax=Sedimentibacter sp. MB31-C6 TaxID=3109366 RepID=UPI002DDCD8AA|nr:hypothetical protein [Sedimentibacter sp. MB36-C1]WSI03969.1 hypothetical protein U8307_13360 [Sedimentibacter sp. MB36-C1]
MIKQILQQACENIADYTETSIPVTVELDLVNSILTPGPGEFQRFCYIVTQVEEPIALSHWLLGICPDITEEDLGEVTVFINNVEQDVVIGENVQIRTEENPDPPTGCVGLKFDFALEEENDVMTVCFELTTTYQIGPNNVCLSGGGETETGLNVCGPVCGTVELCETTVFQTIGTCVPVTVTPFAEVGDIDVTCLGDATVSNTPCIDTGVTSCTFYVSQNLCVEVPVSFGALGEPGETIVTCGEPNQEGCVINGNDEESTTELKSRLQPKIKINRI